MTTRDDQPNGRDARYIRFDGILREDLAFEFRPGWETTRVFRRPDRGDGEFVLELLDAEDDTLTRVSPAVDFRTGCLTEENDTLGADRVVAYVPYHPAARRLLFRRGDTVIFEASVAPEPPTVRLDRVERTGEDELTMAWSAESAGERDLTFNVVCVLGGERYFPLARGLSEQEATLDLSDVPGGRSVRAAVLATDGIRSSFVASDPFETREKQPTARINSPADGAVLPPDQPVSLVGLAVDVAGAPLPSKGLVWEVDGGTVAEGARAATAEGLEPGEHRITLTYEGDRKQDVSVSVAIRIAERNERQERHRRIVSQLSF